MGSERSLGKPLTVATRSGEALSLRAEAIDVTTYGRQLDKLGEELTLANVESRRGGRRTRRGRHPGLPAERILPRASDLWVQASLEYEQLFADLFFPEGNRLRRLEPVSVDYRERSLTVEETRLAGWPEIVPQIVP